MAENENEDEFLPPKHTNTFGIPQEHALLLAYDVYKPSLETRRLKSERDRTIFAEAFIEHIHLGTLSDLSVRAMAKAFGPNELLPMVFSDPLKLRIHYDSLSVDLPLEECYHLTDEEFWKRVVLAKSNDKALAYKRDYDWKNHAISLKFVELIESCSAEYFPEEEITTLALKIKDFVTTMHITKLQSLQERTFEQYFASDVDSLGSTDSTDISSVSSTEETSIPDEEEELPPELQEQELQEQQKPEEQPQKTEEDLELEEMEAELRAARKAEQREAHEKKRKAIEMQMDRRQRREERRLAAEAAEDEPPQRPKKKKRVKVKSVFDIEISEDEDDGEVEKGDKRNPEKYLHRMKKYKYPPEHCHHIDLSFLRYFDNLVSFAIEFQGPTMQRDYHDRHFNFSYQDVEHLAFGISFLQQLKTFRLRNSRMDARKLEIILKSLATLEALEVVDFGYDQLQDDCGKWLFEFFHKVSAVKSLELQGNFFSTDSLSKLGLALGHYRGELDYLGLAGNPLGDEALHELVTSILGTEQVRHLCLTAVRVSQEGIVCCIANELLREHAVLRQLDLIAIPMGYTAGNELIKALNTNLTIQHMDVRGCDLDFDVEMDVEVVLRRNRYLAENSFIGDTTKTEAEVTEFVNRVKNKILLGVMEGIEKRAECLKHRPDEFSRFSKISLAATERSSIYSLDKHLEHLEAEQHRDSEKSDVSTGSYHSSDSYKLPFVYDPNNFDDEEFMRHIDVPGPGERYYYFRDIKNRVNR